MKRAESCNHHPEIKSQLKFPSRLKTCPQAFDASAAWLRRAGHVSVPPAIAQLGWKGEEEKKTPLKSESETQPARASAALPTNIELLPAMFSNML